jgi:phospholipid/cholesterol/gamma-HCH transport system permease protein
MCRLAAIMEHASSAPASPTIAIDGDGDRLTLTGALDIRTLAEAEKALKLWPKKQKSRALDLSKLSELDTPGALFLCGLRDKGVALTGIRAEHKALIDLVGGLDLKPLPKQARVPRWRQIVVELGKGADETWHDTLAVITFMGRAASAVGNSLIHPRTLRLPSISRQIAETGINALPIVGLMAIMISIVIGYQGVAQLRPYGGEDFTINLVAVSVFREMGVLITAIMVAGRSGAAFTAEIGVMKAREEVDALNVMGMDPMNMLVVPRLIGLVITLPLLTFFSDVMGLVGGALIAQSLLNVSPLQYIDRVHHSLDGSDLFVGLFKAPIFGFLIAVIGCMHGLRVRGSAESVGQETTRSVVKSIFVVIVLDALFSILFEKLDL